MVAAGVDVFMILQEEEPERVLAMRRAGEAARCWFDYYATERDPWACSPYLGIAKGLALRRKQPLMGQAARWSPKQSSPSFSSRTTIIRL